jgi:preprotein translocase subunit SecB
VFYQQRLQALAEQAQKGSGDSIAVDGSTTIN